MKKLIAIICIYLTSNSAMASPLVNLITGGALLVTGGVFEIQRDKARDDKEEAQKQANDHGSKAILADQRATYYYGAAVLEYYYWGNTSTYRALIDNYYFYGSIALNEAKTTSNFSNDASNAQDRQNLYKGISLTSFGVGSVLIIMSTIEYLIKTHTESNLTQNSMKINWIKNFIFVPTKDFHGMQIQWNYKWGQ